MKMRKYSSKYCTNKEGGVERFSDEDIKNLFLLVSNTNHDALSINYIHENKSNFSDASYFKIREYLDNIKENISYLSNILEKLT